MVNDVKPRVSKTEGEGIRRDEVKVISLKGTEREKVEKRGGQKEGWYFKGRKAVRRKSSLSGGQKTAFADGASRITRQSKEQSTSKREID